VSGLVTFTDRLQRAFVKCGDETNVLDMGNGRLVDLHTPEIFKPEGFTFTSFHDQMTFFDTDFYRKRDAED